MIETLHIENFRCLRDVKLTLGPLTVLVGANASGKSSAIAAVRFDCTQADYSNGGGSGVIQVTTEDDRHGRSVRRFQTASFQPEGEWWPDSQVIQLDLGALRRRCQLQESRRLESTGFGLPNLFATLTRKEQDQVASQFCSLVPMFRDVVARPGSGGEHRLVFQDRWKADVWYEPQQVSDGTLLMLAYLLLPYQNPAPDLVAIEEPERGLHPFLLGELVTTLRKLANGELGPNPVQIILATHSADLLEHVEPSEVRFFHRRHDTGETVVREAPTTNPGWPKLLREYDNSLGDLWLSGGLGGVPGA